MFFFRYSTWEPEDHILDPRLVVAYEEKEERDRASGYRKRGPKPKRLLLQRLYGMDLRSAHKGKEKLCFSLARRFGGGDSSLPGAKTGQAEFSEKTGGTVLPFSLRKQRKNQKYLRLSRKKFPRMASLENRNCRHEFFLNDAVDLEAQQSPEDWEAVQHTSKEDGLERHLKSKEEAVGQAQRNPESQYWQQANVWGCFQLEVLASKAFGDLKGEWH
uniref:Chromobox 7 n=1 Tax=Pavo cristatus TaxID=9049 RepID=A0A8C9FU21_PAVCR